MEEFQCPPQTPPYRKYTDRFVQPFCEAFRDCKKIISVAMTATAATVVFVTFLLYLFAALSTLVRIIRTEEANATNNALFSHAKTG